MTGPKVEVDVDWPLELMLAAYAANSNIRESADLFGQLMRVVMVTSLIPDTTPTDNILVDPSTLVPVGEPIVCRGVVYKFACEDCGKRFVGRKTYLLHTILHMSPNES
ncbi:hypothetical protein HDU81_009030, partial [Chytriomyces hyalinus]